MSYLEWLQGRVAELRLDRRRAQWRRYSASPKGRERQQRYDNTVQGQINAVRQQLRYRATLVRSKYSYQRDGGANGGRLVDLPRV